MAMHSRDDIRQTFDTPLWAARDLQYSAQKYQFTFYFGMRSYCPPIYGRIRPKVAQLCATFAQIFLCAIPTKSFANAQAQNKRRVDSKEIHSRF